MSTETTESTTSTAGAGAATLSPDDERILLGLFKNWDQLTEQETLLPPMSPLAQKLLALDQDKSAATMELTKIVESDPVLTGRILGLANSAALTRTGKPVYEVMAAVIRLGADTVFEAAFAQLAALWLRQNTQMPDKALINDLWLEYLITAFCSREIANAVGDEDIKPSMAYAAGLLHDVGTLGLGCAQPGPMSRFLRAGYCVGTQVYEKFIDAHAYLGAALLRRWGIPIELIEVARRHHAGFAPEESGITGVVFLGDHLHQMVLQHERASFKRDPSNPIGCFGGATDEINAALVALGLTDELDQIVGRVAGESKRIEVLAMAVSN